MASYCLSFHARYRCEHAGACCTANWPIPIEPDRLAALHARGVLDGRPDVASTFSAAPLPLIGKTANGACVFYDTADGGLCAIQRDAGPEWMPSACCNFPRVALRDARGVFVTLSHYCPTAARLLLRARDITVVEAPASLSLAEAVEGLDATTVMPPLLREGMLTDLAGYGEWERQGVALFNESGYSPRAAIEILDRATAGACTWTPGRETLAAHVAQAYARARLTVGRHQPKPEDAIDRATKAFLAAHFFASWSAYQDGGLAGVVRAVASALDLLESRLGGARDRVSFIEAVGSVDLRLRHRISPREPGTRTCHA